jgi:hypothetical protein
VKTRRVGLADRGWVTPAITYLVVRLVMFVIIGAMRVGTPGLGIDAYAGRWDGSWYLRVITQGYPRTIPNGPYPTAQSTLAFFPLFPRMAQFAGWVFAMDPRRSLWVINLPIGLAAVLVWWRLVERRTDRETANFVAALMCVFPGAYVFALGYSEPLFLLLVGACLLALEDRRWWWAGFWCAWCGLTRPNAIALMAAVAVAAASAVMADRHSPTADTERRWRGPVGAVVLAPLGIVGFFVFLARRTGTLTAWFVAERRGWRQHYDLGRHTLRTIIDVARHPFFTVMELFNVLATLFALAGLVVLWRSVLPRAWKVYATVILALALGTSELFSVPRFTLAAMPVLVAVALRLGPVGRQRLLAASAMVGALLVWLIGTSTAFPP